MSPSFDLPGVVNLRKITLKCGKGSLLLSRVVVGAIWLSAGMNFGSVTFFIFIFADDNEVGFYEASGYCWTDMLIHFWVSIVLCSICWWGHLPTSQVIRSLGCQKNWL